MPGLSGLSNHCFERSWSGVILRARSAMAAFLGVMRRGLGFCRFSRREL
jgi:hypothetical protein